MAITSLALMLAISQRPTDQYTLGYASDSFVVRKGAVKDVISRKAPEPAAKKLISFRRDKKWAVWDDRGLSTRDGDWSFSDHLDALPLSIRLQKKAQIQDTLAKIKAGKRTKEATGISGARRIGSIVYLLPRWDSSDGQPWLEALVAVDLSQEHPKARLVGAFTGLSLARGAIDDRLGIENGLLTVPTNTANAWGMATFDPKTGKFGFKTCGVSLIALEPDLRLIEGTSYGTTLVGRWDGTRTIPWLETHGDATFVEGDGPILVRTGDRLRNAVTGAEVRLAGEAEVRRGKWGVVVFWPSANPRSARLYEPSRFEELARWESGTK